jgi:hypothetical protein
LAPGVWVVDPPIKPYPGIYCVALRDIQEQEDRAMFEALEAASQE